MLMLLPRPAERSVEHLLDGTQGDPIVLGTEQEVEPNERSIEKLGLGHGQVFQLRDVELLPQLLSFADLLRTGLATSCAILRRASVGCGAVLEQARSLNACLPTVGLKFSRAGLHAPRPPADQKVTCRADSSWGRAPCGACAPLSLDRDNAGHGLPAAQGRSRSRCRRGRRWDHWRD